MFMTERALAQFQATDGWKVGIDGSITSSPSGPAAIIGAIEDAFSPFGVRFA
jgi:lipid-binding SYLF domain-containing protein